MHREGAVIASSTTTESHTRADCRLHVPPAIVAFQLTWPHPLGPDRPPSPPQFEFEAPPAMLEAVAAGREPFAAGQFASFDVAGRSESGAALMRNRTWTVSSHPRETAARRGGGQGAACGSGSDDITIGAAA
jgi:hypothetical protein